MGALCAAEPARLTKSNQYQSKAKLKQILSDEDQRFFHLGFRTLPHREGVTGATNELVNRTREEEGI